MLIYDADIAYDAALYTYNGTYLGLTRFPKQPSRQRSLLSEAVLPG